MIAPRAAVRFLSPAAVAALHRESLADHGGVDGIRDEALLHSALHPCTSAASDGQEATIHELAALLAFGLATTGPFNDGNARTALIASFAFMEVNGLTVEASERDAYEVFTDLAAGTLTVADLAEWLSIECAP